MLITIDFGMIIHAEIGCFPSRCEYFWRLDVKIQELSYHNGLLSPERLNHTLQWINGGGFKTPCTAEAQ